MKYKKSQFIMLFLIIILLCGCEKNSLKEEKIIDLDSENEIEENIFKEESIDKDSKENFFVEVKGAVITPGVYEVTNENIINDVIKLAGGFNKYAYTNNINLSKKVYPEMVIYVYNKNEYTQNKLVKKEACYSSSYDIDTCLDKKESIILPKENNIEEDKEILLVNINTASLDILTKLPEIGDTKAQNIILYRNKTKFEKIEDIKNVDGIGSSIYEKIKDFITV